jgi:hypothetical protein
MRHDTDDRYLGPAVDRRWRDDRYAAVVWICNYPWCDDRRRWLNMRALRR